MALFKAATVQAKQSFGKAPLLEAGSYPARLLSIFDLGLQPGSKDYPKEQYKLVFEFECLDEYMQTEEGEEISEQPRTFTMEMSYQQDGYMHEKSTIFQVMTALGGFSCPLTELVGKPCMISLIVKKSKSKDSEYNQIKGVTAMRPKEVEKARALIMTSRIFSLDETATKEMFDTLPSFGGQYSVQSKIKASLTLHKDAPQLAAALGIEKVEVPVVDDATDTSYDETVFGEEPVAEGAVADASDDDEVDPFA